MTESLSTISCALHIMQQLLTIETVVMGRLSAETCNLPFTNKGHIVTTVVYLLTALCAISVTLRIATKLYFVRSQLFWDDYVLVFCVVSSTDSSVRECWSLTM